MTGENLLYWIKIKQQDKVIARFLNEADRDYALAGIQEGFDMVDDDGYFETGDDDE